MVSIGEADEYASRRARLAERLAEEGYAHSPSVRAALASIPRERFVPTYLSHLAYDDAPLSIGHGQTISAPHMVAILSEALELAPGQRILEVGAGSGYQAAVLATLVGATGRVITIERIGQLAQRARMAIAGAGIPNVEVRTGDGSLGLPLEGPFDRILVTAAAPDVPAPLVEQLAEDGLLVVPIGDGRNCELTRVRRARDGYVRVRAARGRARTRARVDVLIRKRFSATAGTAVSSDTRNGEARHR